MSGLSRLSFFVSWLVVVVGSIPFAVGAAEEIGLRPVGEEVVLAPITAIGGGPLVEVAVTPQGDSLIAQLEGTGIGSYRLSVIRWRAGGELEAPIVVAEGLASLQGLISRPDLEADARGNWIVVWTATREDTGGPGIFARRFDADDRPLGATLLVSGSGPRPRVGGRIAVAPDGSFTVGFTAAVNDSGTANDLFARRFGPDGRAIGSSVQLNVPGPDLSDLGEDIFLGDLERQSDGTLIAVWGSYVGEGDLFEVYLRRFDSELRPLDLENRSVNSNEEYRQSAQAEPALAIADDGDFLVVFRSTGQDGSGDGIAARHYASSGEALGDDFLVNDLATLDQLDPDVAATPGGGWVTLWLDACYYAPGCELEAPSNDGSPTGVFARTLDRSGAPRGPDRQVPIAGAPLELAPRIASGGGVVTAVWVSQGPGEERELRARRFAAPCVEGATTLCLHDGRFRASVEWRDAGGAGGPGVVTGSQGAWGSFAFFLASADDLVVKLLDAGSINGRVWVYLGSLSDVEFDLRVLDTDSGLLRSYRNPPGRFASFGDVDAFPADADGGAAAETARHVRASDRAGAGCPEIETSACLLAGRFEVTVAWSDGRGGEGDGRLLSSSDGTATFWFFTRDNPEVVVKVLDGRAINERFWVYVASLTDVELSIVVRDTVTGRSAEYPNPLGTFASFGDVDALVP